MPQWVEQAGKGAAENWPRSNCDPERATADLPLKRQVVRSGSQRGHARSHNFEALNFPLPPSQLVQPNEASRFSLATLPALFDPLRCPSTCPT